MSSSPQIRDAIGVFPGIYPDDFCDAMIAYFDVRRGIGGGNIQRRTNTMVTDESVVIGTDSHLDVFDRTVVGEDDAPNLVADFNRIFWEHAYKPYSAKYPILTQLGRHRLGTIKIQQTRPTEGYHIFHCEHGDLNTSRRLGFVILYLNDVAEGGETEFLYQSQRIKPTKGTLIFAPASFTHTHRGNPPLSEDKFIVTTWLEFIE